MTHTEDILLNNKMFRVIGNQTISSKIYHN